LLGDTTSAATQVVLTSTDVVFLRQDGSVGSLPLSGSGVEQTLISAYAAPYPVKSISLAGSTLLFASQSGKIYASSLNAESLTCIGQSNRAPIPTLLTRAGDGTVHWVAGNNVYGNCLYYYNSYHDDLWSTPMDGGCDGGTILTTPPIIPDAGAAALMYAHIASTSQGDFAATLEMSTKKATTLSTSTYRTLLVQLDGGVETTLDTVQSVTGAYDECTYAATTRVTTDEKNIFYSFNGFGVSSMPLAGCPDAGVNCATQIYSGPVADLAIDDRIHVCRVSGYDYSYCELSKTNTSSTCDFAFDRIQTYSFPSTCALATSPKLTVFALGYSIFVLAR
jgi:hypothetical protein